MKNYFTLPKISFFQLLIAAALAAPFSGVSQATLVKDLAPGNSDAFSYNAPNMIALGNKLIFVASTPELGLELYVSDGTAVGTTFLKDINPGSSDAEIKRLFATKDYVFFFANDGTHGTEVWRTDGTPDGTILVKDLAVGSADGVYPYNFNKTGFATDSLFYFISGSISRALHKTNGTPGNMELVRNSGDLKDILGVHAGNVYFTEYYYSGNYVSSLWKTNGSASGTQKVKQVNVTFSGIFDYFVSMGNNLFLVLSTPDAGAELWKSDGTDAGTERVKDIAPGAADGINTSWTNLYVWNNELYFVAYPGPTAQELWKSDGTEAGTVKVKSLPARYEFLAAGVGRLEMLGLNNRLLFTAYNDTNGNRDFWATDGTDAGTTLLASQTNGTYFTPVYLTRYKNKGLFSATNSTKGTELFQSDGTVAGTIIASDIYTGSSSSSPQRLTVLDSTLFFSARANNTGYELFKYLAPTVATWEVSIEKTGIDLSPNPASNVIAIHAEKRLGNVRLVNQAGITVYTAQVDANDHIIPVSGLRDGVYYVVTNSGRGKIVLQKG